MRPDSPIITITDDLEKHAAWLAAAEPLHRTLRPDIPPPYAAYMRRMFAEGAGMAVLIEQETVRGIAVYRAHRTTFRGYRFYLDDLVTEEAKRGRGFGAELLVWCEAKAKAMGCDFFDLESGVQRARTHKFYFRQGLGILSFGFSKSLL